MADEKDKPPASEAELAALAKRDRIEPSAKDLAEMRAALGLDELEDRIDVLEKFARGEGNVPQPRRTTTTTDDTKRR